ncbi:30686_t:CDS:2, partial [Gigaspora margarita]
LQNIEYSETGHMVPEFHDSCQGCKGFEKVRYKNDNLENIEGLEDCKYDVKIGNGNY